MFIYLYSFCCALSHYAIPSQKINITKYLVRYKISKFQLIFAHFFLVPQLFLHQSLFTHLSLTYCISFQVKNVKHHRPRRFCIFCHKRLLKLTRHIKRKHKDEPRVSNALKIKKRESTCEFARFRREGIVAINRKEAETESPSYHSERSGKNNAELTKCNNCSITIAKRTFSRHQKFLLNSEVPVLTLGIPQLNFINKNFEKNILSKLRSDAIGNICRTDETILRLGSKFFWKIKSKEDKSMEVYKGIRGEMRCLAKCYILFLEEESVEHTYNNSLDMFNWSNFEQLSNVIEHVSKKKRHQSRFETKPLLPDKKKCDRHAIFFLFGKT